MASASQRRTMKMGEFLQDMRSGLEDSGLMRKYGLSESGLNEVFEDLLRRGLISVTQLRERSKIKESQIFRAFAEDQEWLKVPD